MLVRFMLQRIQNEKIRVVSKRKSRERAENDEVLAEKQRRIAPEPEGKGECAYTFSSLIVV